MSKFDYIKSDNAIRAALRQPRTQWSRADREAASELVHKGTEMPDKRPLQWFHGEPDIHLHWDPYARRTGSSQVRRPAC
jgi:hypothetical protein